MPLQDCGKGKAAAGGANPSDLHNEGVIKLDEVEPGENCLKIEGVLEVTLLYLTSDDEAPVQAAMEQIPFKCSAEAEDQ